MELEVLKPLSRKAEKPVAIPLLKKILILCIPGAHLSGSKYGAHHFHTWRWHIFFFNISSSIHASPQIPDMHMCTSASCVCASPQIPDVHVCTSANRVCASPQIPDVHVCTSANRVCARHDSRDLPGHRNVR